ncbi:unnamed protein product [Camellia sinensis]
MRLRRRQPYSHRHIQRTPLHLPRLRRLPHLRLLRSIERLVDPRRIPLCQALRVLFHGLHDLCSLFATLGYVLHLFSTTTQVKLEFRHHMVRKQVIKVFDIIKTFFLFSFPSCPTDTWCVLKLINRVSDTDTQSRGQLKLLLVCFIYRVVCKIKTCFVMLLVCYVLGVVEIILP